MKCPKCGYTSFDYLDECKKCGADLSAVRSTLGVIAISPDEIALSTPTGGATESYIEETPAAPVYEEIRLEPEMPLIEHTRFESEPQAQSAAAGGEEDIFGTLVEPTGYTEEAPEIDIFGEEPLGTEAAPLREEPAPRAPTPPPAKPAEEEDEFLDLDFGSIFEEEEKK